MLTLDCFSNEKPVYVFIAILFAEDVLPIFEKRYSFDLGPRKAIEAAKNWLQVRTEEAADAADVYTGYTDTAADAAYAAYAAYAAAYAVYTAYAAHAVVAATDAAYDAADAADKQNYIHSILLKHLDKIIQFHLDENLNLRDPDQVFQWLSEEKKEDFIYNINLLI
jgi:hypothetical protein